MAHPMVGKIVDYTRPVVTKPGFRRLNEEKGEPEEVPAEFELRTTPATVIGVVPRKDAEGNNLCPVVHLAFLHPEQLAHLGGSGWRDAFERTDGVKPGSHPDVDHEQKMAYYSDSLVESELADIRRKALLEKAKADAAKQKAESDAKAAKDAEAAKQKAAEDEKRKKAADDAKAAEDAKRKADEDAKAKAAKDAPSSPTGAPAPPTPIDSAKKQ